MPKPTFTKQEYSRFVRLVRMSGSHNQMDRITSRLEMPKLVKELGREKCEAMWEVAENDRDTDPDYV